MNQINYYTINRYELNNRILTDEINRANEERNKRREFVSKNKCFHQ